MVATSVMEPREEQKRLSVLVVEDNALIRMHVDLMLRGIQGLQCVGESESVVGAIEDYRRLRPDVVILDLKLTDGSGVEVLQEIRKSDRACRIAMFSGTMTPREAEVCRSAGADACFNKMLDVDRLQATLEEWAIADCAGLAGGGG